MYILWYILPGCHHMSGTNMCPYGHTLCLVSELDDIYHVPVFNHNKHCTWNVMSTYVQINGNFTIIHHNFCAEYFYPFCTLCYIPTVGKVVWWADDIHDDELMSMWLNLEEGNYIEICVQTSVFWSVSIGYRSKLWLGKEWKWWTNTLGPFY